MTDLESLCEDWADEERMHVMFGPLRSKQLNPLACQSQITFWTNLIQTVCRRENKCSFHESDLERAFQRNGRTPQCLQEILEEGRKSGVFLEGARYEAWLQSRAGWTSWMRSMSWLAARSLQDRLVSRRASHLIVPSLVEELASRELARIRETRPLLSTDESKFILKEDLDVISGDQNLIFDFLSSKRLIDICSVNNIEIVKVALKKDETVSVDDNDVVLLKIRQTLTSLEVEIEKQENAIKVAADKVKQYLKSGSKSSAKNMLRKQKTLESRMQKTFNQKMNLETIIDELLNVNTNKKVIESYKSGLGELREKMRELNSENVDEILSDIRDTVKENDEISDALSADVLEDSLDLEELEKELSDLNEDDKQNKKQQSDDEKVIEALEKLEVVDLEPQIGNTNTEKERLCQKV